MSDEKCYKVCRKRGDDNFVSCVTIWSAFILDYGIGVTTVPKIGKCFVFRSLRSAKRFIKKSLNPRFRYVILSGQGINLKRQRLLALDYDGFWHGRRGPDVTTFRAPPGTFASDSFAGEAVVYPESEKEQSHE